jgi:platelet-activating factor acetylhydrolase
MPRRVSDEESVELSSLLSNDFDAWDDDFSPDSPLAMHPPSPHPASSSSSSSYSFFPQPKWLTNAHQGHQRPWYLSWPLQTVTFILRLLRPRLTIRYALFCAVVLYALYCLARGSPLLASPLPGYTGPYGVGAVDIEVPLPDGPKRVSDAVLKASGDPAFEVETALMTIYYPTEKDFRSRKPRYHWIPKPVSLTAQGYARFAHVDNFLVRPIFTFALWAIGGSITIPAEVDAPLLAGEKEKTFPVMIFSHGFASSRTDYTNFLGSLASRGHVIAALEHRDGSGPGSFVRTKSSSSSSDRRVLPLRESDLRESIDTPAFKRAQLAFRDAEMLAAIQTLSAVNEGQPITNTRDPVTTFDAQSWASRLDFDHLTIGGHSYGATGALQALSTIASSASPVPAAAGLILDPGKSSGQLNPNASVPLLVVHSNSWSRTVSPFYGRPHFDTVRDLVAAVPASSWFLTSIGTAHPSVTDAPLLEPLLLSWTTGANLDVNEALREYVHVADDFSRFVRGGKPAGVLAEPVTHLQYGEWVSEERKAEFPKEMAKLWEVHVVPDSP